MSPPDARLIKVIPAEYDPKFLTILPYLPGQRLLLACSAKTPGTQLATPGRKPELTERWWFCGCGQTPLRRLGP